MKVGCFLIITAKWQAEIGTVLGDPKYFLLICISLMTSEAEHFFFILLYTSCISSLPNFQLHVLCPSMFFISVKIKKKVLHILKAIYGCDNKRNNSGQRSTKKKLWWLISSPREPVLKAWVFPYLSPCACTQVHFILKIQRGLDILSHSIHIIL